MIKANEKITQYFQMLQDYKLMSALLKTIRQYTYKNLQMFSDFDEKSLILKI